MVCWYRRAGTTARLCRSGVKGEGGRAGTALALTQIVPNSSSLHTLFYSVIYNSVGRWYSYETLTNKYRLYCMYWTLNLPYKESNYRPNQKYYLQKQYCTVNNHFGYNRFMCVLTFRELTFCIIDAEQIDVLCEPYCPVYSIL